MSVTISGHLSGRLPGRRSPVRPPGPSVRRLPAPGPGPQRRVRDEVRDGLGVIAFSAAASSGLALLLTVLLHQAG